MLQVQRFEEERGAPSWLRKLGLMCGLVREDARQKRTNKLAAGDVLVSPHAGVVVSIERSKDKLIDTREGAALAFEIKLVSGETLLSHPRAVHSLAA